MLSWILPFRYFLFLSGSVEQILFSGFFHNVQFQYRRMNVLKISKYIENKKKKNHVSLR